MSTPAQANRSRSTRKKAASSPKKVLVTGATGFVGRHVVRALSERGYVVRALVRESSNRQPIEAYVTEWAIGDLSRPETLVGCCDGVDAVIHTACAVAQTFDAGRAALEKFMEVNRDGTVNLANEVVKVPGLRLVHTSSTAAMGAPQSRIVDENSPCNPTTPYQRSKRAAELELLKLHQTAGLNVVIIRPCVVAGKGKDRSELLKMFQLVRRGMFPYLGHNLDVQKPLIHVDDLVSALIAATELGGAGSIYLVHSGARHTLGEILAAAGEIVGVTRTHVHIPVPAARVAARLFSFVNRIEPNFNPPITSERIDLFISDRKIDIARAQEELEYRPQHQDVREMLRDTWEYYKQKGLL